MTTYAARTHVDAMYEDFNAVFERLSSTEPSLASTANESFRKVLLVAAASYFERRIKDILFDYVLESSGDNVRVAELVRHQILERGYHALFAWDARNANRFWRLFGEAFRSAMRERVNNDAELEGGVRAFLELGNDRNRLVHQDFGSFQLDKTSDEIYGEYRTALHFVEALPHLLRNG